MTATRDRRSDLDNTDEPAWDERPIVGSARGLPWWGAVLLAFGLTAVAAVIDMQRADGLGRIFQVAYLVGCVAAVGWVQRKAVFTAMVQPPLIFAIVFVLAYLIFKDQAGESGMKQFALSIGLPLANNFPTMAITTILAVVLGVLRLFRQRNPERSGKGADQPVERLAGASDEQTALADKPQRRGRRDDRDEVGPPAGRSRFSRGDSGAAPARSERATRADRAERASKPDRRGVGGARPDRPAREDRRDRPERPDRADRGDQADRGGRADRARSDRAAGGRPARGDRSGSGGRPDQGDRPRRDDRQADRRRDPGREPRKEAGRDPERGGNRDRRPLRDERARDGDPRRGEPGGRSQPPRRRPRGDDAR